MLAKRLLVLLPLAVVVGCGTSNGAAGLSAGAPASQGGGAGGGLNFFQPVTPTSSVEASAQATCAQPSGNLYVRSISPHHSPQTVTLGIYPAGCGTPQSTIDLTITEAPTVSGYCTQLALAKDNPGYDANSSSSKPLKKVFRQIGPAC